MSARRCLSTRNGRRDISFAEINRQVVGEASIINPVKGLAKIAAQLAEDRPDDPLFHELQALVLALADGDSPM
jgi:hypothetical protein